MEHVEVGLTDCFRRVDRKQSLNRCRQPRNGSKGSVYFAQTTRLAVSGTGDERDPRCGVEFHGRGALCATGVFTSGDAGAEWIARHQLTAVLTGYEIGDGSHDLAFRDGGSGRPTHTMAQLSM